MHNVEYFFSYSRIDSEFVLQLDRELKNAGLNGWLDQSNISPGERWDESIEKALQVCETFIVVLSSSSVKSKNVMDEVSYAISKEKAIVPVLIEKCEIPFRLARFQYIDFTGDYKRAFNDLLNTLRTQSSDQKSITDKKDNNDPKKKKGDLVDRKIPLRYQSDVSARQFLVKKSSKIAGILLIILAVILAFVFSCPTNVQYFVIYTLIGIGIALVLVKSAEKSTANITIINLVIVLSGGVALPFILFFTNPIGSFKADKCNLKPVYVSTTIFVHGKQGRQDMILRQKGNVIMDVNGERKRASINENGQAFFQNLQLGDRVQIEIDFSEPYKSLYKDSVYTITAEGKIYLEVALQGIDKVEGMVLYNDTALSNVIVKLVGKSGFLLDTTGQTGDYSFIIPEPMQKNSYEVWFSKEGFKSVSKPAYPQSGEPLNIVMEKR